MKGIGIIRKLSKTLFQHALTTICKSFLKTHLDFSDLIYDQPIKKIETIQCNVAFAITGAIKGTSLSKL